VESSTRFALKGINGPSIEGRAGHVA
jgi:hypothetical protein